MGEQCMVLSGEWVCGEGGKWDFIVEKNQFGRMVEIYDGIGYQELESRVLGEFKVDERQHRVTLSYWSPSSFELATGIKTPPVLLSSDGSVGYFLKHLKVSGGMNLFARFERKGLEKSPEKEFVSPTGYKLNQGGSGSYAASRDDSGMEFVLEKDPEILDDSGMGFVSPTAAKFKHKQKGQLSSVASKVGNVTPASKVRKQNVSVFNLDDIEFVREAEKVEEQIKSETLRGDSSKRGDDSSFSPRGYDKEFWRPLLDGDYGGSNAVNVVFNENEIVDDLKKQSGPRTYMSFTNNCFDHMVQVGGDGGGYSGPKDEIPEDYNPWMSSGMPRRAESVPGTTQTRKLDEIDDEEFDIPPLFDDTEFDAAEILDMDVDETDGEIYVGKVFGNKEDCQISLAIYAIKNQFQFKQTRTKLDMFVVQCPDAKCDWRVTAHEVRGCGYYEIRKAQLDHSCPIEFRNGYKSRATSRVIAAVARDLQRLVLEELRVNASYMKCYRAKDKAIHDIRGTDEDSYLKLPEYLYMLKLANPGTVVDLQTDLDDDGDERFHYLFLSFGASIDGFKKLRHVLVIDGTHLSGKYKGVLLTASGQDANFQIFPLAFAIVDSEDEDAWTWFLQKVERILRDSSSLAIISDRAVSISNAVSRIYPQAKHGACIVHLARNVNSRYSSKNLAKMVTAAAMAHRPRDFKDYYSKIISLNSACGIYLAKIGVARWSRSNFPGDRYNIMTSNIAEQLNKALLDGRGSPIMELVIFIQRMMTRWFCARRKKAEKHRGLVSVEVDKVMTKNMATVRGSKVNSVSSWSSEIVGKFGRKDKVFLGEKKCSCKYFDDMKIPCGHAIIAADGVGVPYDTLCGHWYKTATWREKYAGIISPEGDPRDFEIPEEVSSMVLYPPLTKSQAGRRRKKRIPSTGEIRAPRKKLVPNKCGRCRLEGHNRTNCSNPI